MRHMLACIRFELTPSCKLSSATSGASKAASSQIVANTYKNNIVEMNFGKMAQKCRKNHWVYWSFPFTETRANDEDAVHNSDIAEKDLLVLSNRGNRRRAEWNNEL